jgi:hypothetical protein
MGRVGERWVRAHTPDDVPSELIKLMHRHVDVTAIRLPYSPSIWVLGRVTSVADGHAEISAPNRWFMGDRLAKGERRVMSSVVSGYGWPIRRGALYPVNELPSDVAVGDCVVLVHAWADMCKLGPERETHGYLSWLEEQEPFVDGRLIQRGSRVDA